MKEDISKPDTIKSIILKSGVLDEHDKHVGGTLYSPQSNQELTADALAQYLAPHFAAHTKQAQLDLLDEALSLNDGTVEGVRKMISFMEGVYDRIKS